MHILTVRASIARVLSSASPSEITEYCKPCSRRPVSSLTIGAQSCLLRSYLQLRLELRRTLPGDLLHLASSARAPPGRALHRKACVDLALRQDLAAPVVVAELREDVRRLDDVVLDDLLRDAAEARRQDVDDELEIVTVRNDVA